MAFAETLTAPPAPADPILAGPAVLAKPLGFLNSPALIATTRATSSHISYGDVANLISRLLPSSLNRAIWIAHPYALSDLVQLRDTANRVVWVNALGGAQDKVPGYLFGRPVSGTDVKVDLKRLKVSEPPILVGRV